MTRTLLTAAQMRAIEQAAIESGDVTGLELMERAGRGTVEAILEWRPELAAGERRAVVLCGPGNNGGDGFVVARLLKERGWAVEVFLYGDEAGLPPDAAENALRWRAMGGEVTPLTNASFEGYLQDRPQIDLCVDALFGIGLSRPLEGLGMVEDELNAAQSSAEWADVVAIDLPSGWCADSGRHLGAGQDNPYDFAAMADLTVTYHRPKLGHYLAQLPTACGTLVCKDIGL